MEQITVDSFERQKAINKEVTEAISTIKLNAANGVGTTEFSFPKEIGGAVKSKITELLDDSQTRFTWCVVKKGTNQYTGKVENFISETIGDQKFYKLKVY